MKTAVERYDEAMRAAQKRHLLQPNIIRQAANGQRWKPLTEIESEECIAAIEAAVTEACDAERRKWADIYYREEANSHAVLMALKKKDIEAAVAEETARCAEAVARMKNQRQAYREILRNPTAQLPKHGHWADPFFAEAEAGAPRGGEP